MMRNIHLGIRDIGTIKKEYEKELSNLRVIEGQFNIKSEAFESDKKKFEEDIKSILKENEEQNKKIRFIELKEKAQRFFKEENVISALEFANAALDISNNDTFILNIKGRALTRLNQYKDAVDTFLLANKINPTEESTIVNTVEALYFSKDIEGAKKLISQHKPLIDGKGSGKLIEFFKIIELYIAGNKGQLLEIAKSYVDTNNLNQRIKRMNNWDLRESQYFAAYEPDSELKTILQNIFWYWDGQITGKDLLEILHLELPKPEAK